jgi:hypothetical protein
MVVLPDTQLPHLKYQSYVIELGEPFRQTAFINLSMEVIKMSKLLVVVVVATSLILGAVGSLAGGTKEKTGSSSYQSQVMATTGMAHEMMGVGQVTAVDGDTIEVRSEDGITRSFKITAKTQEQNQGKLQTLSAKTIKVGDTVYIESEEQGRDVSIYKISESGWGTWIDDMGEMKEDGSGQDMKGEPKTDFESESRSPGEGGKEDPTK